MDIEKIIQFVIQGGSLGLLAVVLVWLFPKVLDDMRLARESFAEQLQKQRTDAIDALAMDRKEHIESLAEMRESISKDTRMLSAATDRNTAALSNLTAAMVRRERSGHSA